MSSPPDALKTPQQARSRETERRLITAAIELLREGGLEACQATAVAERAHVAAGSVYRRFANKEALIEAALTTWLTPPEAATAQSQATAHASELCLPGHDDLRATLRAFLVLYFDQFERDRFLYLALETVVRTHASEGFRAFVAERRRLASDMVTAILARAANAEAGADLSRIRLAFVTLSATLRALLFGGQLEDFGPTDAKGAVIDGMVEMLAGYILAEPSPKA